MWHCIVTGLDIGYSLIGFWANGSGFLAQKCANERFAQKNEQFGHSLIFGEQPERFTHITHQKRGNEWIAQFLNIKNLYKTYQKIKFRLFFAKIFERIAYSLIYNEQPERITHGCSFVLSNLSESLTVAHLIWAKWMSERMSDELMSDERMSDFSALYFKIQLLFKTILHHDSLIKQNIFFCTFKDRFSSESF